MIQTASLTVEPRQVLGKRVRALRRRGITPVHLYGQGIAPMALQADTHTLRRLLPRLGKNHPLSIQVKGQEGSHIAFVREVQIHPVTGELLHVDFYRVDVTQRTEVEVPVVLVGEAPAVRRLGGSLTQVLHAVTVECLPLEVPDHLEADVSSLEGFDHYVRVADLRLPPGVALLTDPEEVVAYVSSPREEVVAEAAEAPAEVEVAREAGEGEEEEA